MCLFSICGKNKHFGGQAAMAGPSLWVKLSGKHVDPRAAQQFREQDFPQPEPCTVVQEPPFFSPDAKLSVAESFKGATVLITGAVGFVGSVVLEQLLRLCPEITRIYLVVRYAYPLRFWDGCMLD